MVACGEARPERGVMAPAPWGWGGGMDPRREAVQLFVVLRGEWRWRALAPPPPVRGVTQRLL